MNTTIKCLLTVSICLAVGFCVYIGFGGWFCNIELSKEVVPLDVISLLLSAAITLYMGFFITKKITEQRAEKEFMLQDIKNIENSLTEVEKILKNSTSIDVQLMTTTVEQIVIDVNNFGLSMSIMDIKGVKLDEVQNKCLELYRTATDFDSNTEEADNLPIGAIRKSCSELELELRRIFHSVNVG